MASILRFGLVVLLLAGILPIASAIEHAAPVVYGDVAAYASILEYPVLGVQEAETQEVPLLRTTPFISIPLREVPTEPVPLYATATVYETAQPIGALDINIEPFYL